MAGFGVLPGEPAGPEVLLHGLLQLAGLHLHLLAHPLLPPLVLALNNISSSLNSFKFFFHFFARPLFKAIYTTNIDK